MAEIVSLKVSARTDSGSRAALIPESHNYPGFPGGVSGPGLLTALRKQAETYGVTLISAKITDLKREGGGFTTRFGDQHVQSRFVLLATGIVDKSPDLPSIKEPSQTVRYDTARSVTGTRPRISGLVCSDMGKTRRARPNFCGRIRKMLPCSILTTKKEKWSIRFAKRA